MQKGQTKVWPFFIGLRPAMLRVIFNCQIQAAYNVKSG
jgi:hypothetical protein